jgi:hypothetical protein
MVFAVQTGDSRLRAFVVGHFHETEAFAASRIVFADHFCGGDLSELCEHFFQRCIVNPIAQVSHIQPRAHTFSSKLFHRGDCSINFAADETKLETLLSSHKTGRGFDDNLHKASITHA